MLLMTVFIAPSKYAGRSLVVVYLVEGECGEPCMLMKFDIVVWCLGCEGVSLVS